VSLLWPDTLNAGLFPGSSWLQAGRKAATVNEPAAADAATMADALQAMLDTGAEKLRAKSRLRILVSDSVAAITVLPWQEALLQPREIENYARICFEKLGVELGADWVLHAGFRHFGGMGIAYALPRKWLAELARISSARKLKLESVLPISAAAFFNYRRDRGRPLTVLLLREENRTSALIVGANGLAGRDVEPVITSAEESGTRLLRRIEVSYPAVTRVIDWSTASPAHAMAAPYVPACLPNARSSLVPRGYWN
jgi:hypothetical protein